MDTLVKDIRKCDLCSPYLELGPRPIVSVNTNSKIVVIGQAPGTVVHRTGIPWDDKSGNNLREWMGVDNDTFYEPENFAIIPMGFCYPGKGKSGDLPPRKECAPKWHNALLHLMPEVQLTLLIGKYAQDYYLKKSVRKNLTETVKNYKNYLPQYFVLPHPSPRNNIWMKKNEWFKAEIVPELKQVVNDILN